MSSAPLTPKKVIAYTYSDHLLESVPDLAVWQDFAVDRIYQDWGNRQQWQQLLQDYGPEQTAQATVVLLVRKLGDLGESFTEISERLAALAAGQIQVAVAGEQAHPFGPGVQQAEVIRSLQAIQTEQRSQQLQRGHARNRLKALPPPGRAPYGYRRGRDRYVVDRSTAPVVKEFFEHFLLYGCLRSSVRHLRKKYNKKISVSTGQRWLTSPVYRGDLLYQTGEVVRDTHAAILSRDEAAQIDRLIRRNRRLPARAASAPRSLSGLVVCQNCLSALKISRVTGTHTNQEYLYLRPVACSNQPKCKALPYQDVLEKTIQQVCEDLPPAVNQAGLPNPDQLKQKLNQQIAAKQAILDQLPALVEADVLDSETAELRAYKVRTELAALHDRLAQLPPVNLKAIAQVASLPQFWLDLSEAERRFYFREFIRQIQIVRTGKTWQIQLRFIF